MSAMADGCVMTVNKLLKHSHNTQRHLLVLNAGGLRLPDVSLWGGNFYCVRNGIPTGLLLEMNSDEEPREKPPGWRSCALLRF